MKFFENNCCDGIYRSIDVHFTNHCPNHCAYCIDKNTQNKPSNGSPQVDKIVSSILSLKDQANDVLILGGEPFLYISELLDLITQLKNKTSLKVYITTSMPYQVFERKNQFEKILDMIDGLNISAHHYKNSMIEKVLKNSRQLIMEYYKCIPHKEKIRICLNLVKGILDDPAEIKKCVHFYRNFGSIKLNELQNAPDYYVSFENIFGAKLPSPFSRGCWTDVSSFFPYVDIPVILKRSCFLVEKTRKASLLDGAKVFYRKICKPKDRFFKVIFENGQIRNHW